MKLRSIIASFNPKATLVEASFGKVDLDIVLGSLKDTWVANNDDEDDFRAALSAVKANDCSDPDCADPSHAHARTLVEDCHDEDCKDESHSHSHTEAKAHSHEADCHDEECKDETHSHSHAKVHSHDAECHDEQCKDESHSHSHSAPASNPEEKFGITSFVYSR